MGTTAGGGLVNRANCIVSDRGSTRTRLPEGQRSPLSIEIPGVADSITT
jgi:hypothetical protein